MGGVRDADVAGASEPLGDLVGPARGRDRVDRRRDKEYRNVGPDRVGEVIGESPCGQSSQAARCCRMRQSPKNVPGQGFAASSDVIRPTSSAHVTERYMPLLPTRAICSPISVANR